MNRDFMLCEPCAEKPCNEMALGYVEFAGRFRAILSQVTDEDGHHLGADLAMHFTPHSMRAFLISASVALGAPKDGLKWLQGWNAKGGEAYVRTCGMATTRIQDVVAHAVRNASASEDPLGEFMDLQKLSAYLGERGVHALESERIVKALMSFPKEGPSQSTWSELETNMLASRRQDGVMTQSSGQAENPAPMSVDPMIRTPTKPAKAVSVVKPSRSLEEHGETVQTSKSEESENAPNGYVISISGKKQLRRLHYCGACYRTPGVDYIDFENRGKTLPAEYEYDDYCHQCWRDSHPQDIDEDSVRIESESSSTLSESGL